MYKSNCYNFEWLQNWLLRNLPEDYENGAFTSAEIIAKNFSNSFFDVSEEDIYNAMIGNGCTPDNRGNHSYFCVSHNSAAYDEFKKHWD